MTDEAPRPDQTGTGTPRDGDVRAGPTGPVDERADTVEPNRSGSGGSGGSADPNEEGSTGATMEELLEG
jgi:hypothetical protein